MSDDGRRAILLTSDIRSPTSGLGRPGGDLLSRVLGRSTIGAEGFHVRVRDGIGCLAPRYGHQVIRDRMTEDRCRMTDVGRVVSFSDIRHPSSVI